MGASLAPDVPPDLYALVTDGGGVDVLKHAMERRTMYLRDLAELQLRHGLHTEALGTAERLRGTLRLLDTLDCLQARQQRGPIDRPGLNDWN